MDQGLEKILNDIQMEFATIIHKRRRLNKATLRQGNIKTAFSL